MMVASAWATSKTYDTSLAEKPCNIVTAKMVADTFKVPVEQLEQSDSIIPLCFYEMEENGKIVDVTLSITAFESDNAAAESFREATQSMTATQMAQSLEELGIDLDEADDQPIGGITMPDMQPSGVQFESIQNLAKQARFQTNKGVLHLLEGNLYMILHAYYGKEMPIPNNFSVTDYADLEKATSAWTAETIDVRKEQTVALAKAALKAL